MQKLNALVEAVRRWFREWQRRRSSFARSRATTEHTAESASSRGVPLTPEAEHEFADRVDKFSGLYESLHGACVEARDSEECRWVLEEWEVRLTNSGGEAIQRTWQDVVRSTTNLPSLRGGGVVGREDTILLGTSWLEVLHACGMERDGRPELVLKEHEKERYRISGATQAGKKVKVELPCWMYKGRVIERGIARAVAEGAS